MWHFFGFSEEYLYMSASISVFQRNIMFHIETSCEEQGN